MIVHCFTRAPSPISPQSPAQSPQQHSPLRRRASVPAALPAESQPAAPIQQMMPESASPALSCPLPPEQADWTLLLDWAQRLRTQQAALTHADWTAG